MPSTRIAGAVAMMSLLDEPFFRIQKPAKLWIPKQLP